ncbi:MAG: site-specific integrase [Clostridiales Family XIII bacterium]|nr:site-specific integrase [Clostridiales Family XIII bacterium]
MVYGKDYGEWVRKRDEIIRQDALGIVTTASLFGDAFHQWFTNIVANREIKDSTLCEYERLWLHNIKPDLITGCKLFDIKTIDVQQFISRRKAIGASDSKIKQVMKLMGSFFRYAHSEGYIHRNPMANLPRVKPTKASKIIVFSDDEIARLLSAAEGNRLRFLFYIALGTGARDGELSALDHGDIEGGILHITKTATTKRVEEGKGVYAIGDPKSESGFRDIPLSDTVLREYEIHLVRQRDEYTRMGRGNLLPGSAIFENGRRSRMRTSDFRRALISLCAAADVTYRKFHTLRHTFITKLLQSGEPLVVVKDLAGHSKIEQTMAYVHVEDDNKVRAAASIENIFKISM